MPRYFIDSTTSYGNSGAKYNVTVATSTATKIRSVHTTVDLKPIGSTNVGLNNTTSANSVDSASATGSNQTFDKDWDAFIALFGAWREKDEDDSWIDTLRTQWNDHLKDLYEIE